MSIVVPLKSLCQIKHGGTPSKANPEFWKGEIPWISPKDMKSSFLCDANDHVSADAIDNSSASIVPENSILIVVRSGILAHSLPVARVGKPLTFNQDIKAVIPNQEKIDPEYLYWFLRANERLVLLQGVKKGATVHSVQSGFIENLSVPIISRVLQRRIVDILSRAEGIVRLRREAQKKAAEIIPALFVDMFGDPSTNPRGWPLRKVSDFVTRFEGGKNIQAGSESGSDYRILKVSAVTSGKYRESESKPAPDGYQAPVSHFIKSGDMLFSRANTEELVGATAIVHQTNGKTLLPDKLWRFIWSEPVEPQYMHALFQSARVRRELGKLSSGTSASMRNISQVKLFDYVLPIAPFADQKKFAELANGLLSITNQQSSAMEKAEASFNSFLAYFFK
jgi:type I restriction enzyme S subunit